jgi:hypothetical protein
VTARKLTDQAQARSSTATTAVTSTSTQRKPWKKKTPVEVVMDQITRLREDVTRREEELKQSKRQMQKLDEVLKVLEST